MGYYLSETAPAKSDPAAKNRVRGFFGESVSVCLKTRRAAPEAPRKNYDDRRKSASGIPFWPSRDPIGEQGGVNLYSFLRNSSVSRIDYLGREDTENAKPLKLSTKELSLQIGNCGAFRFDFGFLIDGPDGAKGMLYQKVVTKTNMYWCDPGEPQHRLGSPATETKHEAWNFGPGISPKDSWMARNQFIKSDVCKGNVTITAEAYATDDPLKMMIPNPGEVPPIDPSKEWPFSTFDDPPYGVDVFLDQTDNERFKAPNAISNKKSMTLYAEWDCCEGQAKTKVKIDGKDREEFDNE